MSKNSFFEEKEIKGKLAERQELLLSKARRGSKVAVLTEG